tara:strand:- start:53 stop:652 length:600 start_codon:yes stop_codon:yes gene_type:complete
MKLLLESWKRYLNEFDEISPSVVTVDFDNTLKMKDTKTGNGPVIDKIKELLTGRDDPLRPPPKVYIVSRRKPNEVYDKDKETEKDYESAEAEIKSFIKEYELTIHGIHLTSWQNKGKIIKKLGSNMHIDDSEKEWRNIEKNLPDIKLIKVDRDTGKIKSDLEEDSKPNPWAICGAEVGAKSKKYKKCVHAVKGEHGIKK